MAPQPLEEAARRGELWLNVEERGAFPQGSVVCNGCGRLLGPPGAFAPTSDAGDNAAENASGGPGKLFCEDCKSSLLGPACRSCGAPTSTEDSIVALDAYYHRAHFVCAHRGCARQVADSYFIHEEQPYCHEHFLECAADRCGRCERPVDGGLRALGQAWHEQCLKCEVSDEPLQPTPEGEEARAFLLDGRPLAAEALVHASPVCGICKEPAVTKRIAVGGMIYHNDCFRCVHCKEIIGERRFVWYDDEPYLDGCYQTLFGALAEPVTRALMQGEQRRYALVVPLQTALGPSGMGNFTRKHSELLPDVKRNLRERGITCMQTFLFQSPAVAKPSLLITFTMPSSLNAREEFILLLQQSMPGQEWDKLLANAHDPSASKGNAWHAAIVPEIAVATPDKQA